MVIKLQEKDRNRILDLVEKEKELNLFIIGDVENYGFDKDFLEYWGYENEEGKLTALLLRFYESFVVYGNDDFDVKGFLDIMKKNNFNLLSGARKIVEKFQDYYDFSKKRDTYFAKLDHRDKLYNGELLHLVQKTKVKDVVSIKRLFDKIEEFTNVTSVERMKQKYIDETGRGCHIKGQNGEIICNAETTAENSMSAMIMAVCTDPDNRKDGYATAVVSQLCHELLDEGKSLCLFYDNPKAGKIYKRIGFEDIGIWSMWE